MRVVVNQMSTWTRRAGIGHYTAQLLRCLRQIAPPGQFATFPPSWLAPARTAYDLVCQVGRSMRSRASSPIAAARSTGWRANLGNWARQCVRAQLTTHFRHACARKKYTLYHEPNFLPLASDLPTVVTVHDLSVLLHPEWHPADRVRDYERHFHRGVSQCEHVLTISEFCRRELIRSLQIAPARVTRTYMGVRPGLRPMRREQVESVLRRLALPMRYLLHVGTIEPRKNLAMLLRAYCALPHAVRERWPLLLVGQWGWNSEGLREYYEAEARHRGVLHLGYVSEVDLPALYNGARALVFPSFYEGFGMPPVEMMACGGAVLASTAEAVVETVGRRAHLIDPADESGWREALARIVRDDDWRRTLCQGTCELARNFTWERCAADTWQVYRSLSRDLDRTEETISPPVWERRRAG